MNTWRKLIADCQNDDIIIYCTLTEKELDTEFDGGFGCSEGKPFTAWSNNWVYFPVVYDGSEWVSRVRRNICNEASLHVGGD